ncbi:hypothetical protein CCACVL1_08069 [Corchorus capsularis]|uniref:Uncharacterized protein n=1 Tax=Corchorus capsularis TaxID=210143 RepID=A0A1R3J2E6_COCAP|nr:hypothetical protein CCACVL1_08069 [Corchorus capsularis]
MGCCLSSTAATRKIDEQKNQNPTKSPHRSPLKPSILQSDKTPPPPPEEEEEEEAVIKEVLVLSETSTLYKKEQEKITQTETPLTLTQPPNTQPDHVSSPIKKPPQQQQEHDLSQVSEMYSMTETMSTTATTTTTATGTKGPKEDEATSKDNSDLKRKSPAKVIKKRPSNGERGSVRARTVDPSPEKRARGRGRGRGLGEVRSSVQRNVGSRSSSPGTGRAGGVGRGSVGKSPTTVTGKTDHSKPVAPMTAEGQSQKEEGGNGDDVVEQQGTESLENPLVSLECFIFL